MPAEAADIAYLCLTGYWEAASSTFLLVHVPGRQVSPEDGEMRNTTQGLSR